MYLPVDFLHSCLWIVPLLNLNREHIYIYYQICNDLYDYSNIFCDHFSVPNDLPIRPFSHASAICPTQVFLLPEMDY